MSKLFLPKHARTHLPGGSDPLEITDAGTVAWMRRSRAILNPQSITQNSITEILWDADDEDGTGFFVASGTAGIILPVAGVYAVTGELYFADFGAGGKELWVGVNDLSNNHVFYNKTSDPSGFNRSYSFVHRWAASSQIRSVVLFNGSVSANVEGAYMEVVYLGGYDGNDPDAGNPGW